ncbi:hypothetical protein ABFB09_01555 [Dehalogenimonas sp. THU2]|jgi:hypothetical protein|uniref:hypothetical protein n=1 Tax=Dehalogenimonas sp. THU2 TaxID=3151121 RepID=UPI00321855C0
MRNLLVRVLTAILVLAAVSGTAACDDKFATDEVNIAVSPRAISDADTGDLSAEATYIIRCASAEFFDGRLNIETTKDIKMKPAYLLFVLPGGAENSRLVLAPVSGEEINYNFNQAAGYSAGRSAIDGVIASYGITYPNWLAGAMGSGNFPCCE